MKKEIIVIGHVDHGKTTFIRALQETIYGEAEASMTVGSTSVRCRIGDDAYILFDYPGHADYVDHLGEKDERYAVLICSAMDCLRTEAMEQVALCRERGIEKIAVFITAADNVYDSDLIDFLRMDVADLLEENGYDSECPVCVGSGDGAMKQAGNRRMEEYRSGLADFLLKAGKYFA